MHLGNGAITPECAALTFTVAAAGLGLATWSARREPASRERLLLAVGLGGLVFAAQAVNVPLLPGSSAHLVGGVLLAWALGPALGAWTMAVVLTLQALTLGDGGLLALGANLLNMGLLPAALVAAANRLGKWQPLNPNLVTNSLLAALAVPLAAGLILVQTALFRSSLVGWTEFAGLMMTTHLWIGLAEGAATFALLLAISRLLVPGETRSWRLASVPFAAAILVAALAFPWSSALPDGYEAAAENSGLTSFLSADLDALAAVGSWNVAAEVGQQRIVAAVQGVLVSESALVIAMTVLAALLTGLIALSLAARRTLA